MITMTDTKLIKIHMQSIVKSIILALIVSLQLPAKAQSNNFRLEVKEEKGSCVGVGPMSCYLVKYYNSTDWEFFYAPIEGFKYEEGFRYKLLIKRSKLANVPADASSYKYELVRVISKKKITQQTDQKTNLKNTKLNLDHQKWFIKSLNGTAVQSKNAFVKFDTQENRFHASLGCNTLNGSFDLKGNEATLGQGMSTQMFCDPEVMKLERAFAELLGKKYLFSQKGNTVEVRSGQKLILQLEAQTSTEELSFLAKHKWKLISLHGVGKDYGSVFIQFDADKKTVFGNSGCNTFRGPVSITGEKIAFKQLASTMMACADAEVNNTEAKLLALLNAGNLRFDIAEQTFNLYQDNRTVATFGLTP